MLPGETKRFHSHELKQPTPTAVDERPAQPDVVN